MRTFLGRLHQSLHRFTYIVFFTLNLIIIIVVFIAGIVYILDRRALILFKLIEISC